MEGRDSHKTVGDTMNKKEKVMTTGGYSVVAVITILLIVLKISDNLSWPWVSLNPFNGSIIIAVYWSIIIPAVALVIVALLHVFGLAMKRTEYRPNKKPTAIAIDSHYKTGKRLSKIEIEYIEKRNIILISPARTGKTYNVVKTLFEVNNQPD